MRLLPVSESRVCVRKYVSQCVLHSHRAAFAERGVIVARIQSAWNLQRSLQGDEVLSGERGRGVGAQHLTFTGLWLHCQALYRRDQRRNPTDAQI